MANSLTIEDFEYMISRMREMISLMKIGNSRIKGDHLARQIMIKFEELACTEPWRSREDADIAYHKFDEFIKNLIEQDLTIIPA